MSAIFTVCKQEVCSQSFRMDATGHYNGVVGYVTSGLRALSGVSRFVDLGFGSLNLYGWLSKL